MKKNAFFIWFIGMLLFITIGIFALCSVCIRTLLDDAIKICIVITATGAVVSIFAFLLAFILRIKISLAFLRFLLSLFPVLPLIISPLSIATAETGKAAEREFEHFRDCDGCSEMITLGPGSYSMGATREEFIGAEGYQFMYAVESPQHQVAIKPFAIAKFAVTKRQFAIFARDTGFTEKGCKIFNGHGWISDADANWQNPRFNQSDQDPVVCVSWNDAEKFITWVNSKIRNTSSKTYRLPTEEEWEYAARAGTITPMYWGSDRTLQCRYENARDLSEEKSGLSGPHVNCDDGFARTAPVGSFEPNPWGLFDMLGNAYQWVSNCSHIGYDDPIPAAPVYGAAYCDSKVARGGSWASVPFGVRSANRLFFKANTRESTLGFRLARDVSN